MFLQLIEGFIEQVLIERTGASPTSTTVTTIWSIITSIFCVGGMVGGAITGKILLKSIKEDNSI